LSGYILNGKGIRVGVEQGTSIFDLGGKKMYDLKGVNIYRLSGELVGHLLDARGADKRLDRDSEGLLSAQGLPQADMPDDGLAAERRPSDSFVEAIRLRRIISDAVSDHPKKG
jgi:hypothetical protein